VASVRPTRIGRTIGDWFAAAAADHGAFEVDIADLSEVALPFMDEPHHPRLRRYVHDHTRAWSRRVEAADAFAFVTPEYNHGISAPLKNALDYLHEEWRYKPVGFVSYGGVSAGTRAVQMTRQVVLSLRMVPVLDAVAIPFVAQRVERGRFRAEETMDRSAAAMLDELARVEAALRPLRRS
jgi:NAD(P)H-dependent FMN reductase